MPWTAGDAENGGTAFVFADPNATNLRMLNTLFALDRARDVGDVLDAIRETQGVPRWSIIAADSEGEALLSQNQVVFDGTQCPDAVTLLTYSQSQDPTSPHHADQTRLYSEKRWVTGRFCLDDILASPALERLVLPN